MAAHSTLRNDADLLVLARNEFVKCGFMKYIREQAAYDRQNNISPRGRFDLEKVPEYRLPDVIKTMKEFNRLVSESGLKPEYHRELTTITLFDFLWNIETKGVDRVFQSCCVVPENITIEEYFEFRESIRSIYSWRR